MHLPVDPQLTLPDLLVIKELLSQNERGYEHSSKDKIESLKKLKSLNETSDPDFDPTVFQFWETHLLREKLPRPIRQDLLEPYIRWAQDIVRFPTDVVMVTHLLLYLTTSIPSALWLYHHFSWIHGLIHWIVHVWYAGSYTLMKHQYVHMNGVLASRYRLIDILFPYIIDPLMGYTWNSYYYHHVKMHHVEGNGPRDLNSTMWYDRDSIADFARYVGRFFFLISLELPLYFFRKGQYSTSFKTAFWEFSNFLVIALLFRYCHAQATLCVFLLPLWTLRAGLMAGNWGQHAFVDPHDPSSDFRSSITLIDVSVSFHLMYLVNIQPDCLN
jgi:hypothetical protein